MKETTTGHYQRDLRVGAINTDNRVAVNDLCRFFGRELELDGQPSDSQSGSVSSSNGTSQYPAHLKALLNPRTVNFLRWSSARMISLVAQSNGSIIAHIGIRRVAAKGHPAERTELVLPFGQVDLLVPFLRDLRLIRQSPSVTFFGPPSSLTEDGVYQLGLQPCAKLNSLNLAVAHRSSSASINRSGAYALTPSGGSSAMAVFIARSLAHGLLSQYEKLGLARKLKSPYQSSAAKGPWAFNADRRALRVVHRGAGVIALQPSLVDRHRRDEALASVGVREFLVDIFDPAAEDLTELMLARGLHYSGVVPSWQGSDYAVFSRFNAAADAPSKTSNQTKVSSAQGGLGQRFRNTPIRTP